jgi:hypothetical protein
MVFDGAVVKKTTGSETSRTSRKCTPQVIAVLKLKPIGVVMLFTDIDAERKAR